MDSHFNIYYWLGFLTFALISIFIDLKLINKNNNELSYKKSVLLTCTWFLLATSFCLILYYDISKTKALEFATGYIIELTLSIDNVFVFILIFSYFKISRSQQHKILFLGVLSALVMRFAMIFLGIELYEKLNWVFYIFGLLLIVSAIKIFVHSPAHSYNVSSNKIMKMLQFYDRLPKESYGDKFIVYENARVKFTPLFIALIFIEKADLFFALDSIPAVLSITQDKFIVFTSNIFAILGLRSLYFVVEGMIDKFRYLKYGIAIILCFVGFKMIFAMQNIHINTYYSLLFILMVLTVSCFISYLKPTSKTD